MENSNESVDPVIEPQLNFDNNDEANSIKSDMSSSEKNVEEEDTRSDDNLHEWMNAPRRS